MTREERKRFNWEQKHKTIDGIVYRQCSLCKEWKIETEEFYLHNKSKPEKGYSSECKKCSSVRAAKYTKEHPEMKYTSQKKYAETPAGRKSKRETNKRRYNTSMRIWIENNPEKMKKYMEDRQHKNHNISKTEWNNCKKYFDYKCSYCGLPIEEHYYTRKGITKLGDFHKEHVDNEGVNNLSNCVPSCGSCNDQKWKFPFDVWYNEDNERYSRERYDKIIKWINEDHKLYIEPPKPKDKYTKRQK